MYRQKWKESLWESTVHTVYFYAKTLCTQKNIKQKKDLKLSEWVVFATLLLLEMQLASPGSYLTARREENEGSVKYLVR